LYLSTSRSTPPSPPPMTHTRRGSWCMFHGRVRDRLVVDVFVALGKHYVVGEHKYLAERVGVEHFDLLEGAGAVVTGRALRGWKCRRGR